MSRKIGGICERCENYCDKLVRLKGIWACTTCRDYKGEKYRKRIPVPEIFRIIVKRFSKFR